VQMYIYTCIHTAHIKFACVCMGVRVGVCMSGKIIPVCMGVCVSVCMCGEIICMTSFHVCARREWRGGGVWGGFVNMHIYMYTFT